MNKIVFLLSASIFIYSCGSDATKTDETANKAIQDSVQTFLDGYNKKYKELSIISNEADWKANTHIVEGDTITPNAVNAAQEEAAKYTGSKENIETATKFLAQKDKLTPLQVKQLKSIMYKAANNPETIQDVVKERIKAETKQNADMFGYDFKIDGKSVSTNDIDGVLSHETNMAKRLKAWEASKEVGKGLKTGLVNLRDLRNKTVQGLGYKDYFEYQVSDYGMTTQ